MLIFEFILFFFSPPSKYKFLPLKKEGARKNTE